MTSDQLHVRCFDSFAQVRADAAGRLDEAAQPCPFDRLDWFEALHHRAYPGRNPLILQARRGAAYAWIFLAWRPDGTLESIANWYSFLFRAQFAGVADDAQRLSLLTALATELRGMSAAVRIFPVVDDDTADGRLLMQAFRQTGWRVVARTMSRKRLLRLAPGTRFSDYWAERPGSLRATVRRKAQRHPVSLSLHSQVDDPLWMALERLFRASWKPLGDDFTFLRAFAEAEGHAGRLRLGLAQIDGEPAAIELWTVERGCAFIHKLAFDERFAEASPGTQLSHAMFAHAIDEDRVTLIDFGTGDNDYKASWMPDSVPMRQIDMFDLRRPTSWRGAITAWISAQSQPADELTHSAKPSGGRRAAINAATRGEAR